jgi:hypothetical protein
LHLVAAVDLDLRAKLGERVNVGVEPAPADHVAARRRDRRAANSREQRPGEEERRADAAGELVVDVRRCDVGRVHSHLVRTDPVGVGAQLHEQLDHRLDVANPRNVGQGHRLIGEQTPGEDR